MRYQFHPGLIPTLATVIFFPLFISLGLWQMERAQEKNLIHDDFVEKLGSEPVDLKDVVHPLQLSNLEWQPVTVSGRFDSDKIILLDNQTYAGRAGYQLIMPFYYGNNDDVVLVNRGWIAMPGDRTTIPEVKAVKEDVVLDGVIKKIPFTGLGHDDNQIEQLDERTFRVQKISTRTLSDTLQEALPDLILRLDESSEYLFIKNWKHPGSGAAKHYGYAFQWFAFSAVLLFLYIYLNLKEVSEND